MLDMDNLFESHGLKFFMAHPVHLFYMYRGLSLEAFPLYVRVGSTGTGKCTLYSRGSRNTFVRGAEWRDSAIPRACARQGGV